MEFVVDNEDTMASAFGTVYKILNKLETFLDYDRADIKDINHDALGLSYNRWMHYMIMLSDGGYVTGVNVKTFTTGQTKIDIRQIQITLKGLKYLHENSLLMKAGRIAKIAIDKV